MGESFFWYRLTQLVWNKGHKMVVVEYMAETVLHV